jgi:hypothetical protein
MKKPVLPKPKPATQTELARYLTEAKLAAKSVQASKQRLRTAKAALKAARQVHRNAKDAAEDTAKMAKAAQKYFDRHAKKLAEKTKRAKTRTPSLTRKRAARTERSEKPLANTTPPSPEAPSLTRPVVTTNL